MKLRIAKKIQKEITERNRRSYTDGQITRSLKRIHKTKSQKDAERFWNGFMRALGVSGRAALLPPGRAFNLLMSSEESDWEESDWEVSE